jgi:hypothetical protein
VAAGAARCARRTRPWSDASPSHGGRGPRGGRADRRNLAEMSTTGLSRACDVIRNEKKREEGDRGMKAATDRLVPRIVVAVAGIVLAFGTSRASGGAGGTLPLDIPREVHEILGGGVVGALESGALETTRPLSDPLSVARWEPGEWTYVITSGAHRGATLREVLESIEATGRGETWKRTIGDQYTLYVSRTAEGSLVMPSEIAHIHKAIVSFEPPLSYLIAALEPGATRVYDGRMDVYHAASPDSKWYSGRMRATTVYAGMYRIRTPPVRSTQRRSGQTTRSTSWRSSRSRTRCTRSTQKVPGRSRRRSTNEYQPWGCSTPTRGSGRCLSASHRSARPSRPQCAARRAVVREGEDKP